MTIVMLADAGSSMSWPLGRTRRVAVLQGILDQLLPSAPPGSRLIAFNSVPLMLEAGGRLPEPAGSTALHLAIEEATKFRPSRLVVISDGEADDADAALAAARRLNCHIATHYCGDEGNHAATAFLR